MIDAECALVDRVFPEVPVRQWVLSVPFELSLLLARNPSALSAVGRLVRRARPTLVEIALSASDFEKPTVVPFLSLRDSGQSLTHGQALPY